MILSFFSLPISHHQVSSYQANHSRLQGLHTSFRISKPKADTESGKQKSRKRRTDNPHMPAANLLWRYASGCPECLRDAQRQLPLTVDHGMARPSIINKWGFHRAHILTMALIG